MYIDQIHSKGQRETDFARLRSHGGDGLLINNMDAKSLYYIHPFDNPTMV